MKINKNCKIELACSTDKQRAAICNPYLEIDDKGARMIATNGQILAIVPVDPQEGDKAGLVPVDAIKDARKAKPASLPEATLACNGNVKLLDGRQYPRPDFAFPNYRAVLPAENRPAKFTVGIDAKLLWELAQAMGTQGVTLEFENELSAIKVRPSAAGQHGSIKPADYEARGVIMPIRIS